MLLVHAAFLSCLSIMHFFLHVGVARPCSMAKLYIHAASRCCMSIACPCCLPLRHVLTPRPYCMAKLHIKAARQNYIFMLMSAQYVHVHAALLHLELQPLQYFWRLVSEHYKMACVNTSPLHKKRKLGSVYYVSLKNFKGK
jgi:hypothetical protein